jgi:hypothetical protein
MPWDRAGAARHTKKANTSAKRAKWAKIANSVLAGSGDEGKAVRIANSKMAEGGQIGSGAPSKSGVARLRQSIGNPDTRHGLLELPMVGPKTKKKPKMRYAEGGLIEQTEEQRAFIAKQLGKPGAKVVPPPPPPPPAKKKEGALKGALRERMGTEYKAGGRVRCRDGCAIRGLTKGRFI